MVTNKALQCYVEIIERPFKATVELFICKLDLPKNKTKTTPRQGRRKRRREGKRRRDRYRDRVRGTHVKRGMQSGALWRLSTDVSCIISRAAVCALCAYRLQLIVIKCIPFGCNNMLQTHACHTASPWQDKLIDAINSRLTRSLSLLLPRKMLLILIFDTFVQLIERLWHPHSTPLPPLALFPSLPLPACSFSALSLRYGSAFCARC